MIEARRTSLMVTELIPRVRDTQVFLRMAAIELRRIAEQAPDIAVELRHVAQQLEASHCCVMCISKDSIEHLLVGAAFVGDQVRECDVGQARQWAQAAAKRSRRRAANGDGGSTRTLRPPTARRSTVTDSRPVT